MTITVYGQPAPQGSKRFVGHAKSGRSIMIESSKAVKPWREAVKYAAIEAFGAVRNAPGMQPNIYRGPIQGPVSVRMVFTLPKPKSAPKGRRTWPDRKPDLSKLVRATEDALTDAGVWEDDARVVFLICEKCFPMEGAGLDRPGCKIEILPISRGVA